MKLLLDTNFLVWVVTNAPQLARFPWLHRYTSWWISPITLLELRYMSEVGRIQLHPEFQDALEGDPRFVIDDVPLAALVKAAIPLEWTRDPFDRLVCGHSAARRVRLCTTDRTILRHHRFVADELSS